MHLQPTALDESHQALIHQHLDKVLASAVFDKSRRQQDLLRYLLKETLAGNAGRLKGYTLGVEIFGRTADFDPAADAIVRVEIGRLRTKLREYYGSEQQDVVSFSLPKGSYAIHINIDQSDVVRASALAIQSNAAWYSGVDRQVSLAVLPFSNLSANPEQEYFVDGIVDNLIFELSRLSGLFLISRQSSFRYRNTDKSAKQIGAELGVKFLLEGSVQPSAGRIRATLKLIDAETEAYVWADRFESNLQEIFALQDEITLNIVKVLQVCLSPKEAELFGHERTERVDAHDALLRGMACHWKYSPKFVAEARVYFSQAVDLDANYASAHAWLARTLLFQWVMRWDTDPSLRTLALEHAKKAVLLDNNLSFAHSMLGWANLWLKQRDPAIASCRLAVATDPNNFEAYLFLSMSLSSAGFGEEGLFYIEKAKRINPHSSPFYEFVHGLAHYVLGNDIKAADAFIRGHALSAHFPPNIVFLCTTYARLGMEKEMIEAKKEFLSTMGGDKSKLIEPPWIDEKLALEYERLIKIAALR